MQERVNDILKSEYFKVENKHFDLLQMKEYYFLYFSNKDYNIQQVINRSTLNKILNYLSTDEEEKLSYITVAITQDNNIQNSGLSYCSIKRIMQFHGKHNFLEKINFSLILEKIIKYDHNHKKLESYISFRKETNFSKNKKSLNYYRESIDQKLIPARVDNPFQSKSRISIISYENERCSDVKSKTLERTVSEEQFLSVAKINNINTEKITEVNHIVFDEVEAAQIIQDFIRSNNKKDSTWNIINDNNESTKNNDKRKLPESKIKVSSQQNDKIDGHNNINNLTSKPKIPVNTQKITNPTIVSPKPNLIVNNVTQNTNIEIHSEPTALPITPISVQNEPINLQLEPTLPITDAITQIAEPLNSNQLITPMTAIKEKIRDIVLINDIINSVFTKETKEFIIIEEPPSPTEILTPTKINSDYINNSTTKSLPIEQENESKNEITTKISKITCSIHGLSYIKISNTFYIICQKCNNNNNLISEINKTTKCENDERDSNFFCNTCNIFICTKCFAKQHKHHDSMIISQQVEKFMRIKEQKYNTMPLLIEKLKESTNKISNTHNKIIEIKEINKKIISNVINQSKNDIQSKLESMKLSYFNQLEHLLISEFKQPDSNKLENDEVEILNFDNIRNRISNINLYTNEIDSLLYKSNIIHNIDTINKLFIHKQELNDKAQPITHNSRLNLINETLLINDLNKNKVKNNSSFNEILKENQRVCSLLTTTIKSISTLYFNSPSFFLRRFDSFSIDEIKYFNKTSIMIRSKNTILVKGIKICGLKIKSIDKLKLITGEIESSKLSIPIQVIVKKVKKDGDITNDYSIIHEAFIKPIISEEDPTFSLYFTEPLLCIGFEGSIEADESILIEVVNKSNEQYLNLYTGIVPKYHYENNIQILFDNYYDPILKHHKTNLIYFDKSEIESDFTEISKGIISDLIYSRVE